MLSMEGFRKFTAHLSSQGKRDLYCPLLIAATAAVALAVQWNLLINPDVAFLTWTASQVMGPPVFGVDIFEINPPLSFMIYLPAAVVAPLIGFDLAIKLWLVCLAGLSIAGLWQSAEPRLRLAIAITLSAYFALALPPAYGQREQIAFLLCAPSAAGNSPRRGWAIAIGVMAGVGFAI